MTARNSFSSAFFKPDFGDYQSGYIDDRHCMLLPDDGFQACDSRNVWRYLPLHLLFFVQGGPWWTWQEGHSLPVPVPDCFWWMFDEATSFLAQGESELP